jgi:hypothetical protein
MWEIRARHSASELRPVGGICGMIGHREGGGEEVSVGGIIATVHFSRACCDKIVLRRSGSSDCWSHANPSSVSKSIRALGSTVVPAPDTSRWRIGRHHPSHLGKRHAVGRARDDTRCSGGHPCYVLEQRDSSVMSLPAENVSHTASRMNVVMRS